MTTEPKTKLGWRIFAYSFLILLFPILASSLKSVIEENSFNILSDVLGGITMAVVFFSIILGVVSIISLLIKRTVKGIWSSLILIILCIAWLIFLYGSFFMWAPPLNKNERYNRIRELHIQTLIAIEEECFVNKKIHATSTDSLAVCLDQNLDNISKDPETGLEYLFVGYPPEKICSRAPDDKNQICIETKNN